nr:uncharacterized protein LOC113820909 [Penaeus vannamei]
MQNRSWVGLVVETAMSSMFLGFAVFFVVPLVLVWRLTFGALGAAAKWASAVRIPGPVKFFREKQRGAIAVASAPITLVLDFLCSWIEGAAGRGSSSESQQAYQSRRQTSSAAHASSTGSRGERDASGRRSRGQSHALGFLHSCVDAAQKLLISVSRDSKQNLYIAVLLKRNNHSNAFPGEFQFFTWKTKSSWNDSSNSLLTFRECKAEGLKSLYGTVTLPLVMPSWETH